LDAVISLEEVRKIIDHKPPIAKSQCPVWHGIWRGGLEVAVKQMLIAEREVELHRQLITLFVTNFQRICTTFRKLKHPRIVQMIGHTPLDQEEVYIIMEYMKNGSLFDVIHDKNVDLPWHLRLRMAMEGAKAMVFLHENHIIHRDLKTANMMVREYLEMKTNIEFQVDEDMHVKLADFGESMETPSVDIISKTGSKLYMAPELLDKKITTFTNMVDVYAFG
jgi:serine/threonine protein kinase